MPRSSEMDSHEELYSASTFLSESNADPQLLSKWHSFTNRDMLILVHNQQVAPHAYAK